MPALDLLAVAPPPADLLEVVARLAAEEVPDPPQPRRTPEPLDALIRTILGQQNTGAVTRRQFDGLRRVYPRWEAALLDGPDGIEAVLREAGGGLSRMKAGYVYGVLAALEERTGSLSLRFLNELDDAAARAALESLPGVGQKTTSLILLFDLLRPAIPVDGNIERVAKRLEWVPEKWNAERTERWFDLVLPREWTLRYSFHLAGVRHGRHTCHTRRPECGRCVLRDLCPSAPILGA